jgi:F-type H+-transporting ATPase subunit f
MVWMSCTDACVLDLCCILYIRVACLQGQKRASRRRLSWSTHFSACIQPDPNTRVNSQSIRNGLIVSSTSLLPRRRRSCSPFISGVLAASAHSFPPKSLRPLPSLAHHLPGAWRACWTSTARCVTRYRLACMLACPAARRVPSISLTLLARPIFVQLPKGPASSPNAKSLNPLARYKARYFDGKNASGAPIVHAIIGIFLIGYTVGASLSSRRQTEQRHGHSTLETH